MNRKINFVALFIAINIFSPSIDIKIEHINNLSSSFLNLDIYLLHSAFARRGGGMRAGGMRSSSMRRGMSGRSFNSINRSSSVKSSRYYGGSFQKYNKTTMSHKAQIGSKKPSQGPSIQPINKPIHKPGHKPHRPIHGKPPHHRPPHHRPHHGHHHGHIHHYHSHYGNYWPWFWGSAIVTGAFVSTIPDEECIDVHIDDKIYKECDGVLFEPIYQDGDITYKVIEIKQ